MTEAPPASVATDGRVTWPVVGVGASAGGLDAFMQVLTHLPANPGMSLVLIQHLDPAHKSLLAEALARATQMRVSEARHGELPLADRVYVIPADSDITLEQGRFCLTPRDEEKPQLHLPIDRFLASLATERANQAIGVILSGTASDGTAGLKAIKAGGGITFAQTPGTAKFAGMPQSAIDADVVDFVLPIPELVEELLRVGRHPYMSVEHRAPVPSESPADSTRATPTTLSRIMDVVRKVIGIDFKEFKAPTFERRLARRMALRHTPDRESYLGLLESDADEIRTLSEEVLIHVSSFFRDPEVFTALKRSVFPEILRHKEHGETVRIWSAGCATGEEVYSLAMTFLELVGDSPDSHPVQIFGSDISEKSIHQARSARYPETGMSGVTEDQRRRFFTKVDGGFRVNKSVRDLCVFVRHDLAHDPPFSKIDLVSCRNVLIYFDQGLQKRILPTFHFSLSQPGFLLLGRTEDVSGLGHQFPVLDKTNKIFARSAEPSHVRFEPRVELRVHPSTVPYSEPGASAKRSPDLTAHVDRLLLGYYAPPGILMNERMDIRQFRGHTGDYLQPAPGEPQNNFAKMARPGLLPGVEAALAGAMRSMAPFRVENVEVDDHGETTHCHVVVLPFVGLPGLEETLYLVLFEGLSPTVGKSLPDERPQPPSPPPPPPPPSPLHPTVIDAAARVPRLEHELLATTRYLQSVVEEHGRTNESLGAANEELISGNEELQSLNEELETAKEELQSTNEELITVNEELHLRSVEVTRANSDLSNLLDTVDTAVVILDRDRRIRRFTPKAQSLLNILPSDIGRSFDDIKLKILAPELDRQITEVISTFAAMESEVQDRAGHWFRLQLRPYRAADGRIDGAIVSLFDIDGLKRSLRAAEVAKVTAERADSAKDEFLATLSHELRTPLSALLMQAQLLRRLGADPVQRERGCAAIERSTKLQVQLIDDLLDVSRIVTGKMRVDLQPLDLGEAVSVAVNAAAPLAERKELEMRVILTPGLPAILGDRARLEQVVSNLLGNAIKFTPNRGRIDVSLEKGARDSLHLSVSDTGVGIDPDFLPRIFDRLTQKDSSSTRSSSGLGLGLAIVRYLVEAHGGSVRAESRGAGLGAALHVAFPIMPPAMPATPARSSGAPDGEARRIAVDGWAFPRDSGPALLSTMPVDLAGARIEIVEDNAPIREALVEMLSQAGAEVRGAESAAEGLAIFREFRPHVLLCDIAMPVEDGYAFIRSIRALDVASGGKTPALALTALAGETDRQRGMDAGFEMYLVKPIEADHLAQAVAKLVGPRGARRGAESK